VSRLSAELLARWTKTRRLQVALDAALRLPASDLVSHRFPIERAGEAYRLLDERPEDCLQVLLTYNHAAGPGGPLPPRAEPSAVAQREARSDERRGWGPAALKTSEGSEPSEERGEH
jgi:hypothetical protein